MHVISAKGVRDFATQQPDAAQALANWLAVAEHSNWRNMTEVRRTYPNADAVTVKSGKTVTIFNIRGNRYRLITAIHYNRRKVYTLRLLTHAEYNRATWKETL